MFSLKVNDTQMRSPRNIKQNAALNEMEFCIWDRPGFGFHLSHHGNPV